MCKILYIKYSMLYFYILGDKMDDKTKVIIMCVLSLIESILCLIALITANMTIFLISLVMIVLELIIVLKYFELLKKYFNSNVFCSGRFQEDERTNFIDNKASTATLGISIATIIYVSIGILVLRNTYPELLTVGYTLIATIMLVLLIHVITTQYYKHQY